MAGGWISGHYLGFLELKSSLLGFIINSSIFHHRAVKTKGVLHIGNVSHVCFKSHGTTLCAHGCVSLATPLG